MALLTDEPATAWAKSINEKFFLPVMQPCYVDPNVGMRKFKNDGGLSDEEIATIVKWVDAGAPRGNPADMPPPRQFPDESKRWHIGKPDLVVTMPYDHVIPPDGADWWGYYMADLPLDQDRYIKAIQNRPGKIKV